MARVKRIVGAVVAIVVLLTALVGGAFALGLLGVPSVGGVENRFAGVNETTTTIETNVTVRNPNPIGAALGGVTIDYAVTLADVRIANGTKHGVGVGSGNSTLSFHTAMANDRIPAWWVAHVRNDERSTLVVNATVRSATLGRSVTVQPVQRPVTTDILSAFNSSETRPVDANQPPIEDPVLYVNETGAAWGEVTQSETPIAMRFDVYNPKRVPYTITEIGYEITMNDVAVGDGTTEREYVVPPESEERIRATTAIRNRNLDEWWVSHLERNQVTRLRIDFYARIALPSGATVRLPLDALTYTETIETDVFGNKPDAASPPATETPAGTATPTATETGGLLPGDTATASPTRSPTTTTTEPLLPDDTATPTATRTGTVTPTATPTASPTAPTPTPTATPTPTPTETGGIVLDVDPPGDDAS